MAKIIRLTESELNKLIVRVLNEQKYTVPSDAVKDPEVMNTVKCMNKNSNIVRKIESIFQNKFQYSEGDRTFMGYSLQLLPIDSKKQNWLDFGEISISTNKSSCEVRVVVSFDTYVQNGEDIDLNNVKQIQDYEHRLAINGIRNSMASNESTRIFDFRIDDPKLFVLLNIIKKLYK